MSIPSAQCIQDIKHHEGFSSVPYLCPTGYVSIAYGHNLESNPKPIEKWDMDLAQAVRGQASAGSGRSIRHKELFNKLTTIGMNVTREEAEEILQEDILEVIEALSERCAAFRHLTNRCGDAYSHDILKRPHADPDFIISPSLLEAQKALLRADVLVNMAFNVGVAGLLKFRKTLEAICNDDYDTAAGEMLNSKWASQVKSRAVYLARQMRTGLRSSL